MKPRGNNERGTYQADSPTKSKGRKQKGTRKKEQETLLCVGWLGFRVIVDAELVLEGAGLFPDIYSFYMCG